MNELCVCVRVYKPRATKQRVVNVLAIRRDGSATSPSCLLDGSSKQQLAGEKKGLILTV
jgi:hypothetical protein